MTNVPHPSQDKSELRKRVVDRLVDDYHRRGGYLSGDHVLRAVEKNGLDIEDDIAIRLELEAAAIEIDDTDIQSDIRLPSQLPTSGLKDPLRAYLSAIGSVKLLLPNEEIVLARRIEAGKQARQISDTEGEIKDSDLLARVRLGEEAKAQMVSANLRLVVSIARHYVGRSSLDLLDLIQEGTLGLIKAVDKFEHRRGFKFSTYATWWIRQSITRALADRGDLIRLPVHVHESRSRIKKVRRALLKEYGDREPTIFEIAEQLRWDPAKVQFLIDVGNEPLSLDAPVGDTDKTLSEVVHTSVHRNQENEVFSSERTSAVATVLAELKPKQRKVIARRFGLFGHHPQTLEQIGNVLQVTRERIRQIEAAALEKLRHPSRRSALSVFLSKSEKLGTESPTETSSKTRPRRESQ